ncbi:MAG: RNA polymerase subunit sigma, partial [Kiritimatiellae bacterium]|nr:RNA polymerase subunit sigma [Kiritimatiellia bacterium]
MGKDPHTRFLELHMANQRDIFNYLLAAVHDFQDAEDLLQDVTLVLWKKFDQYKEEFPFLRWALGIARREVAR